MSGHTIGLDKVKKTGAPNHEIARFLPSSPILYVLTTQYNSDGHTKDRVWRRLAGEGHI